MALGKADGSIVINTKILESGFDKGLGSMKKKMSGFGQSFGSSMGSINSSMGKTADKIASIGKILVGAFAVGKLVNFGKEAIKLGSDLAEMENVTNTVFPHMTREINEWSDAALDNFGLTRTMAKNYVGTFGAMSEAFGFSEQKAYEMSTQLAGLSGDVASFFNTSQDEAFTKLKSVFTGETESLKSLGVVMTQTALDQYALANGFGKTVSEMTEAEKVELRLAFVTDKLSVASGDFIRTEDSWANQTKRLSASFAELKTTIGQGLINLFTPIIKQLNTLLSYLYTAAEAFNTFTATLMGKKNKSSGGGAVAASAAAAETMSDVGDAAYGAADGTGSAADATDDYADAQKAAQKAANGYLSTLDEVNRYTSQAADSTSAAAPKANNGNSGSGGSSGLPTQLEKVYDDSMFAVDDIEEEFSEFAQRLRNAFLAGDWEGLGRIIGEKVNEVMAKIKDAISWDNVGPQITYFVSALTTTLNSLIDTIDWHLIGATFGTGVNTIIYTLNLLITGIDWVNIGKSLADGVNGLADTVDWESFGNLLAERFMISWRIFAGFVSEVNWDSIGGRIGNGLRAALKKLNKNADLIYGAMSGFGSGLAEFLNSLITTDLFDELGTTISTQLNSALEFINSFGETFDFDNFGKSIDEGLRAVFKNFNWEKLGRVVNTWAGHVMTTVKSLLEGKPWIELFDGVKETISEIDFGQIGTDIADTIWTGIAGEGMDEQTKQNVLDSFSGLEESLKNIASFTFGSLKDLYDDFMVPVSTWFVGDGLPALANIINNQLANVDWDGLKNGMDKLWRGLAKFVKGVGQGMIDFFTTLSEIPLISTIVSMLGKAMGTLGDALDKIPSSVLDTIGTGLGTILVAVTTYEVTKGITDGLSLLGTGLTSLIPALVAHPAAAIIAGGAAVAAAIYSIVHKSKSENYKAIESTADAIEKLNTQLANAPSDADADALYAEGLLDKYLELNEKLLTNGELSEGEQNLFEFYRDELIKYNSEMETVLGNVEGGYKGTREELEKLIQKQREQALAQAYMELYAEYAKEAAKQQIQLNEAMEELTTACNDAGIEMSQFTDENLAAWIRYTREGSDSLDDMTESQREFVLMLLNENVPAINNASESIVTATESIDSAQESMDFIESEMLEVNASLADGSKAFDSYGDKAEEGVEKTKGAAKDSKDAVKDMTESNAETLEAHSGDGEAYGTGLADSAAKGITDSTSSVEDATEGLASAVSETFDEELGISEGSSSVMEESGKSINSGILAGNKAVNNALLDFFAKLPTQMSGSMGDLAKTFEAVGRLISNSIKSGVTSAQPSLLDKMGDVKTTMVGKFAGLSDQMWAIGYNAGRSLATGFKSVHIPAPVFTVGTRLTTAAGTTFPIPNVGVTWMASGGVIPRNASKFIAGLGDNNHETEVVSPISTMKQAFSEALIDAGITGGNKTTEIKVQVNRRTLFDAFMDEAKSRQDRTGVNPFDMGTT